MKFRWLSIRFIAITIGFLALLFLSKIPTALSQWNTPSLGLEPTYKISDNFGVVVNLEKQRLAEGFFVVREGETWVRFEAQNLPRTIPAAP